ncbi:hypothetical protein [Peptoniphilus asaccharolyticus]
MNHFCQEEEVIFGTFLEEIFKDSLKYNNSQKAYLEIFNNKLEKESNHKEIVNILKKILENVE